MKFPSSNFVKYSAKIFSACFNAFLYISVSLLVFIAVSLSLVRVLLPEIDEYKTDIEIWVSDLIGQQVEIGTLDAAWYGLEPQLVLRGVQLLSDDRKDTLGYFQQARLGIDLFSSAVEGRIRPGAFTLEGARFVLIRHEDGNISLEGFSDPKSSSLAEKNRLLEEWFFKQRLLDVKDSEIVWLDLTKSKKSWLFKDVKLRFTNDGQRHWIDGSVLLPSSLGTRLELAVDVRGSLLSANAWAGNAYVAGAKLNIAEITRNFSLDNLNVSNGDMGFRLWSQWRKAKLYSLQGNVEFHDVKMAAKDAPKIRVINKLATNIRAQKNLAKWEVTLDKIAIQSGRSIWPQTRLDLNYDTKLKALVAEVSYLDLGEVLPIAAFFMSETRGVSKALNGLKISGAVSDLNLKVASVNENNHFLIQGAFSEFNSRAWKKIPGVSRLDGRFKVSNNAASFVVPRQNVTLDYREMFSRRHNLKNIQASVFSTFDAQGLQVVAKDTSLEYRKIKAAGSLTYQQMNNEKPHLDLAFYFDGGSVNEVDYYVPAKLMPVSTVDWLNNSLLDGDIKNAGLLYFGSMPDFPFKNDEGVFNVNLPINNGKLKFSDNWPHITEITGVFDLQSSRLSFYAESAVTINSALSDVQVEIPDYRKLDKQLIVTGKAKGSTSDKLSYLLKSPMGRGFSKQMAPLQLSGDSELELDLNMPLSAPEKVKVVGELRLKENSVLAKEWKLDLENVSANLQFNNEGIWSDDLRGKTKQTNMQGTIETVRDEAGARLKIHNTSIVSDQEITELMAFFIDKANWGQYFDGTTEIETDVIVPLSGKDEKLKFELRSDLQGMQIKLPYPLKKTVDEIKNLRVSTELTGSKRLLTVDYGNTYSIFEISATKDSQQIRRGGIGFQEKVGLPDEIGYRFSGDLKEFAWEKWEPLLITTEDSKALLDSNGNPASIYFDVNVDEFSLFGTKFGSTSIQASYTSQLWSMHLSGPELEGKIFVPVVLSSAPMVVDLDRLYVTPEKNKNESVIVDPRKMPEIKLKVADFKYNGIPFGALVINAKKSANGLRLDTFKMDTKDTSISAQGDWTVNENQQQSQFDIVVASENMGGAIRDWGYADAIGGGKGTVKLKVSWSGKPTDFSFNTASGDVAIEMKDASMLDFELGAARMIGLLLPRRLLLDFRDVFKKGMHFDEIKGKYQIQTGEAFTSGLYLNGPVANIHMAGRIGLSKRDYDQVVTVNRRILGDTLPAIAFTLSTANPIIAAQVYIFKKMFEKQIDDILSVQYTIAGSWEDPVITPVIKNAATGEDLTESILDE